MNLPPGTYTVTEPAAPAGYHAENGAVAGIQLAVGELMSENNNFGLVTPPILTNVQRFGVHMQPVQFVLTFSQAMDPVKTQDLANYRLVGPGGRQVPITAAVYDPATYSVTLTATGAVNFRDDFKLMVQAGTTTGLSDIFQLPLTALGNENSGGDVVVKVNRSNFSGFFDHFGNFVPVDHGHFTPSASWRRKVKDTVRRTVPLRLTCHHLG